MRPPDDNGRNVRRRSRAAGVVENVLIVASLPALWVWFLRRSNYSAFQGWWVDAVLVAALATLLVIAVRRLSRWASIGWEEGRGMRGGREDE